MNASARSNTLRCPAVIYRRSPIATYATGILASFWFIERLTAFWA